MKHFHIQYAGHDFVAIVETDEDGDKVITVGGRDTKCCSLIITGKTIQIRDLFFSKACQAFTALQKGHGTRTLLHASLLFAVQHCKSCTEIILTDESAFACLSAAGEKGLVSLVDHNILVYGKTWYQRILPGLQRSKKRNNHIAEPAVAIARLSSTHDKHAVTFEQLWNATCSGGSLSEAARRYLSRKKNPKLYEQLELMYNQSSTFQEFFYKIHKTLDTSCTFFLECIKRLRMFFELPSQTDSIWFIPVSSFQAASNNTLVIHKTKRFNGISFEHTRRVFPSLQQGGFTHRGVGKLTAITRPWDHPNTQSIKTR